MVAVFQITAADKLLLSRMQALVSLSVVLARKCFAAYAANERPLIGVRSQM